MKFLINSKYFLSMLLKAYKARAHSLVTFDNSVKFICAENDVEMYIEVIKDRMDLDININWHKWSKVIDFLRTLPEQPLSVKLDNEDIDIYCVQCFRIINR